MGKEETLGGERGRSLAAPVIFLIVTAFHSTSWWLQRLNKRASKSATEFQLHAEIKQLLKEANSLSQPSTFAQAAKLRRLAAAKEKELANYKKMHDKEVKLSYGSYLQIIFVLKDCDVLSTGLLVLEDPCSCNIEATGAALWKDPVLGWGRSFKGQNIGWNYTVVDTIYQG